MNFDNTKNDPEKTMGTRIARAVTIRVPIVVPFEHIA